MPRGRKKTEIPTLESYKSELYKLEALEQAILMKLNTCREEIKRFKEIIQQEELKELKAIMDEKNISFDEVKVLLDNHSAEVAATMICDENDVKENTENKLDD